MGRTFRGVDKKFKKKMKDFRKKRQSSRVIEDKKPGRDNDERYSDERY